MSRRLDQREKLSSYRDLVSGLMMKFGVLGKHAIVIAHNAATNSKETTAVLTNQEMSIPELLEAGWGIELDLHYDEEAAQVLVCHSSKLGCMNPLMDKRPLDDVLAEVAAFEKANPDRPIILDFDNSALGKTYIEDQIAETVASYFPSRTTRDSRLRNLRSDVYERLVYDYIGGVRFVPKELALTRPLKEMGSVIIAAEKNTEYLNVEVMRGVGEREDLLRDKTAEKFAVELEALKKQMLKDCPEEYLEVRYSEYEERKNIFIDSKLPPQCELPRFFRFYHFGQDNDQAIDAHQASLTLYPDEETCHFFRQYGEYNATVGFPTAGLATSYTSFISGFHTQETIDRLLECGVRSFKLDDAQQLDARQLQIELFNLEQMARDHAGSPEIEQINKALNLNSELAASARYTSAIDSVFLAPLIKKPLADLETLYAAARYWTGIDTEEYESMLARSEKKYKYHSPSSTFLSAAALGAIRAAISKVDASAGWRYYASLGLKAALTATDLYLYSQSAVPLGAGLLAAMAVERAGYSQNTVTALRYGVSSLVSMALDPGATMLYTIVNGAAGIAGGFAGAAVVNTGERVANLLQRKSKAGDGRRLETEPCDPNPETVDTMTGDESDLLTDSSPSQQNSQDVDESELETKPYYSDPEPFEIAIGEEACPNGSPQSIGNARQLEIGDAIDSLLSQQDSKADNCGSETEPCDNPSSEWFKITIGDESGRPTPIPQNAEEDVRRLESMDAKGMQKTK